MFSFFFIQPVYLNLLLKKGKGKDIAIEPQTSKRQRKRLSTSISINGEVVNTENEDVNIHDYATFEKEEQLVPEFRVSIKSKTGRSISREDAIDHRLERKSSFKNVAKQVISMESVLLKWPRRPRSRHHSSSSEDIAEDEVNRYRDGTPDYQDMNQEDNISVHTDTSELSDSEEVDRVMSPHEIEIHTASLAGSDVLTLNDESCGNLNGNNPTVDEIAKTDANVSAHKRHKAETDKNRKKKHDKDVSHEHVKDAKDSKKTEEKVEKRGSIFRCPCVVL